MTPTATADLAETETETETEPTEQDAILEDLLVEEVSIDGMCGVY